MKYCIYIISLCLLPALGQAQNSLLGVSWDISLPSGSSTNFVDETSIRGGQFDFRSFYRSNISTGLTVGWNAYQEYTPRSTYQIENGAITTDLTKYVYTLPILLNLHYYYPLNEYVRPYVGGGIGTMYSEREIFFNVYSISESKWGFAVRPEVGILFPFGSSGLGALVSADYLLATNDSDEVAVNSTNSFNFKVGFVLIR